MRLRPGDPDPSTFIPFQHYGRRKATGRQSRRITGRSFSKIQKTLSQLRSTCARAEGLTPVATIEAVWRIE
jgi:hypothetical protein